MKKNFAAALVLVLAGCSSLPHVDMPDMPRLPHFGLGGGLEGESTLWRCASGAHFTARVNAEARQAQVRAGFSTYRLEQTSEGYSNGRVTFIEQGGMASLSGANGTRYSNCRKDD